MHICLKLKPKITVEKQQSRIKNQDLIGIKDSDRSFLKPQTLRRPPLRSLFEAVRLLTFRISIKSAECGLKMNKKATETQELLDFLILSE